MKALKDAIEAVDKKRMADNDEVLKELKQIAKLGGKTGGVSSATPRSTPVITPTEPVADAPKQPDGPGFILRIEVGRHAEQDCKEIVRGKGHQDYRGSDHGCESQSQGRDEADYWAKAVYSRARRRQRTRLTEIKRRPGGIGGMVPAIMGNHFNREA